MAFYSFLVFFIKKLEEEIRFCVDYKKLNAIIKKDCYWILFIEESLAELEGAKYFIMIDIY